MPLKTLNLYTSLSPGGVLHSLWTVIVIFVKDGVAFITGIACKRIGACTLFAINPFLFLYEGREATDDELDIIVELMMFISDSFARGLTEEAVIQLVFDRYHVSLTRGDLLYLINKALEHEMVTLNNIPLQLAVEISSEIDTESTGGDSDIIEISFEISQFVKDHSVMLITACTVTVIAVIVYLFRRRPPSNASGTVENSTSPIAPGTESEETSTSKIIQVSKYLITLYASWILFVRSFFLKERPWLIPVLVVIAHLNFYTRMLPQCDIVVMTKLFLWLGIYCIAIDNLGSLISTYALSHTSNLFDQVVPFLTKAHTNGMVEYYTTSGFAALLIGKTAMTATGRAALTVGIISGTGYLINAHLDRNHTSVENQRQRDFAAQEAQRQRDFASQEAQRQRDWQDQKERQKAYESSWNPFKKPPKT